MILKKTEYYPRLFLPCLLHDQAILCRNVETLSLLDYLCTKQRRRCRKNEFTMSLFDVFH